LIVRGKRRMAFEFKLNSAPDITPSMRTALDDLDLEHLFVVHPGKDAFKLGPKIEALPLGHVGSRVSTLT
ncbi:MAG: hypothetical protein IPM13_17685, partial [Phycisphaerales bacterium]|nr:hypothetical protein [Phycisphaerales bacterium]